LSQYAFNDIWKRVAFLPQPFVTVVIKFWDFSARLEMVMENRSDLLRELFAVECRLL
jgi:hypothetical protein